MNIVTLYKYSLHTFKARAPVSNSELFYEYDVLEVWRQLTVD